MAITLCFVRHAELAKASLLHRPHRSKVRLRCFGKLSMTGVLFFTTLNQLAHLQLRCEAQEMREQQLPQQ